jgi:DNA-binding FrmR family transcriptional regulator
MRRASETEPDCGEVLRPIAASRGAINSLTAEVLEGHVGEHAFPNGRRGSNDASAAEDVIAVVGTYPW